MTRDDELDLLSVDTQRLLADTAVSVFARRPAGSYDPVTRRRPVDHDSPAARDVPAVVGEDTHTRDGDRRVRRRSWVVLASDLGEPPFSPTREGSVEEHGVRWTIVGAERSVDGREWTITGERVD